MGPGSCDPDPCHLIGKNGKEERTKNRLLVCSATNAQFTETLSVISLPDDRNSLAKRPGTYQRCCPLEVPPLSTFSQLTAFCFSWATS